MLLVIATVAAMFSLSAISVMADGGYNVTLYANDGYGTQKMDMTEENGLYVLPECDFAPPPEMTFEAWAIGSELGDRYVPGQAVYLTEDTLIVAIWTESASMYETRPNGGITSVNGTFEIKYRLNIQPDTMFLEFYNDYQGAWAEKFSIATMPEYEGALTRYEVPCLHKDTEETVRFRLLACKDGINYYSNEFVIKYTNNRFTSEPEDAMLLPGEKYEVSYALSFTPSAVTVEYKNGDAWEHYSNADASGVILSAGDGEKVITYRVKAVFEGDTYYSREFKVRWCEITEVSTFEELLNAVNGDKLYIKLARSIEDIVPDDELPTKHRLIFDGGFDYVLDLNGCTLKVINHINEYFTGDFPMISVSNDSRLEMMNGEAIFDNYSAKADRQSRGVVAVSDNSVFVATGVDMQNKYTGTVVFADGYADVTLCRGDYLVQNGFAIYLENQASLTLDDVSVSTVMGDSASTAFVDGYGALYSESKGELTINNAFFKSGVQITSSQIGAFSVATHEVTINGQTLSEDIFVGTNVEAKQQNKEYYWYSWTGYALYKTENSLFSNTVRVISYEKKYPISVENGVATVNGTPVTEASYGDEVTIVADTPEAGMEFVRWGTSGVNLADHYSASTTFTMPPAPVSLSAYYGKEAVKSASVNVGDIVPGQPANDTEITAEGGVFIQDFEWRDDTSLLMGDYSVFRAGKGYTVKILVYPPEDQTFDENMTATVNGKSAKVNANSQYAYIEYSFEATPSAGFVIVYDTNSSQLGVGGKVVLDTELMASQSASFKAALDAGKVTYQWYRNGEAVEGATKAVYEFTAEDVTCVFYAAVTADGKTNYGHNVTCSSDLYQLYLNASEIVAGGKAPLITAATQGISIDLESMVVYEILGNNSYGNPTKVEKTVLIPGKSYLLVGKIIEQDGVSIADNANVYVNGVLMKDKLDTGRFFYEFTVPEADYSVHYKTNGAVGIGVTLTVDIEKMCAESSTFKHAVDIQTENPTYQTVFYQWYRDGEPINGETMISYTVTTADKDSYINCKVTLVDGKYGVGEQYQISNAVTVFEVNMPYPKNGEERINSGVYVDGVEKVQIMWWPKETGAEMQSGDTYVEGTVYEYYILFSPKDGFVFADAADRTVYVYGKEATHSSNYAYTGEVTAIHKHQYSDTVWDSDEYYHWQPCILTGCSNPNEEWEGYTYHWGGGATCQKSGICGVCGTEYYADHEFVNIYAYQDDMICAVRCETEGCTATSGDWSYHEGGVSTCQQKSVCDICHHEYGNLAACAGGKATCTQRAKCATCGEEYGELAEHELSEATCTQKAVCQTCGGEFGELAEHSFGEWIDEIPATTEATGTKAHKDCAVCNKHFDGDGNEITDLTISKLEGSGDQPGGDQPGGDQPGGDQPGGDQPGGDQPGGDQPGGDGPATEPTTEPTTEPATEEGAEPNENDGQPNGNNEEGGLPTGAVVGIVIGSVAVVGVGGFALFWFVIKKKSWADLVAVFKKK